MAENPPLRLEWTIPSWILSIDSNLMNIALEGGFSRSDSVTFMSLEDFLTNMEFQKEIRNDFGETALEEALTAARQLLAKN